MSSDPFMIAWLVPILPLIGFVINGLFGGTLKKAAGWLATLLVFVIRKILQAVASTQDADQTIGRGRIRTFEGISHQIYSLTPLATWVHARSSVNFAG